MEELPDYTPPLLDHHDEELDHFLGEIHRVMQEDSYADLSNDFNECMETHVESQVLDVVDDEETHNILPGVNTNPDDEPIYPGSARKLGVCMLLLSVFMVRYRLSDDTMQYLLALLGLLLPDTSSSVTNLYGFRKYLQKFTFLPEVQYYCSFY